jgi:transposase
MGKDIFKELTAENIEYIKHVYYQDMKHVEKTEILSKKFNVGDRTIRDWWQKLDLKKFSSDLPSQLQKAQDRVLNKNTKVLLVTTAQNKTAINKDFLNNLIAYKDYITNELGKQTEIVIIPSKYRNPTNNIEDEKAKSEDWWEDVINDYLFYGKVNLGDTLISCDSHISPTAKQPLDGYEILASNNHLVLGHSKVHFKTLPRFRDAPLRIMSTTGYITSKNYSKSKAGAVAFENHAYGFVVVELKKDDVCYIPRNVKVKSDGSFIDITNSVSNNTVSKISSSLGFILGDAHTRQINRDFLKVSIDLMKQLNPKKTVIHDLLDSSTMNHHESKDMFIQRQKIIQGKHLIEDEVEECLELLAELKGCCGDIYAIESNHDVWMDKHVNEGKWQNDLHNSPAYLKYAYIQQTVDLTKYGNILGYLIHERFNGEVQYVKMGDSLYIGSYQCGLHTDYGINGARGNVRGFGKLNLKLIGGHVHAPVLYNNVTLVGILCNLKQYYNRKGLSSWAYAHSVVHENDKNQLLVFNDDYSLSGLI